MSHLPSVQIILSFRILFYRFLAFEPLFLFTAFLRAAVDVLAPPRHFEFGRDLGLLFWGDSPPLPEFLTGFDLTMFRFFLLFVRFPASSPPLDQSAL